MNQERLGVTQGRRRVHLLPEMQVGEGRGIIPATSDPRVGGSESLRAHRLSPGATAYRQSPEPLPVNDWVNETLSLKAWRSGAHEGTSGNGGRGASRGRLRRRGPGHQEAALSDRERPDPCRGAKALTRLLAQVDRQRSPATGATVATLIARWLEVADLELTTCDGYEGYIRRNILPILGDTLARPRRRTAAHRRS